MRHPLTSIVAFAILGVFLGLARWGIEPSHVAGDAFWYARAALQLSGETEVEATRAAAEFIDAQASGSDAATFIERAETIDPRYPAIFESRPIYPLSVALILSVSGLQQAMVVGALLAGVVFAAVFGWFARYVTGSMLAAVGAVVLAFALPSGKWFAFMYADGWMLALWALVLAFGSRYLLEPRPAYLAATLLGLVVLYLTKPANGAVLVVTFLTFGLGAVVFRTENRRQALMLGVSCAIVGLAQVAVFEAIGLPGLDTTLQDMFTKHFSRPDIPDPLSRLLARDLGLVPVALAFPSNHPAAFLLLAVLLAPLALIRRSWAAAWLMAGLGAILIVLVHPVSSQFPRLLAPIWISAALGGGWWLARAVSAAATDRLPVEQVTDDIRIAR